MVPLSFAGQEWCLVDQGDSARALFWPRENALLVSDLHFEKASFFARTGQMLPPYDSRETLERVADAIRLTGATRLFALGDNFHDADGPDRLEPHARGMLDALCRAVDWVWITGNHDEKTADGLPRLSELHSPSGGTTVDELETAGVILRHQPHPDETRPELSGHFHPKLRIKVRGQRISRPCLVRSQGLAQRMILPAFGTLTGGLDASAPQILSAVMPASRVDALTVAKDRLVAFPLYRAQT